jgi:hypothetical protein
MESPLNVPTLSPIPVCERIEPMLIFSKSEDPDTEILRFFPVQFVRKHLLIGAKGRSSYSGQKQGLNLKYNHTNTIVQYCVEDGSRRVEIRLDSVSFLLTPGNYVVTFYPIEVKANFKNSKNKRTEQSNCFVKQNDMVVLSPDGRT